MKLAPLVALRLATCVLGLASTELAEILSGLGDNVFEQFHLDSAKLLA
jgi:hypothetical protein